MSERIKSIVNPRLHLDILSPEDIQRLHTATLDVIENVGVKFPSLRALDIWEAHGARVDRQSFMVKAPGQLIEDALKSAPPVYDLAARDPVQDLSLDGNHVFLGTDGCGVEVLDIDSGERRRSQLQDVADIARIADALEEIAFHWVAVSAQDCPPRRVGYMNSAPSGKIQPSMSRPRASILKKRRVRPWRWPQQSPVDGMLCANARCSR